MGRTLYRVLLAPALLGPLAAEAGTKFDDGYGEGPTVPLGYPFEAIAPTPTRDRKVALELGIRVRSVSAPRSLLDRWFFDEDDEDWAYVEPRPQIRGTALGLEFGVRGKGSGGLFYAEFLDSGMTDGYWDDIEEPADHLDGDYLAPSSSLGVIAFGADYGYDIHLLRPEQTGGKLGVSLLVGGGLGLGVLAGRLDRWGPDVSGNPAYKRYLDGLPPDSDQDVPRIYPLVDINGGLRLNFGDRVVWRVEGGLHTLLYYGTSLGLTF